MQNSSDFTLVGETVRISHLADPSIGHGQFQIKNARGKAVKAALNSAWLEIGVKRQPLTEVSVYLLDEERPADADDFEIAATPNTTILISFPRVEIQPFFGEIIHVGIDLSINNIQFKALSPIVLERRIPKIPK